MTNRPGSNDEQETRLGGPANDQPRQQAPSDEPTNELDAGLVEAFRPSNLDADVSTQDYRSTTFSKGDLLDRRYRLLEPIGEGGMGSVWLAEQKEPVKRKVAIKLVKAGMDSRQVLARFEAERQALAMMDHPNIAKVLDGGMTEQARPYFVMELVKGVPLTDYCDQAQFSVRERLELFAQVCSAVQHAHQKGIIHRDLKPSNVLVTEIDGRPVAKVIDFGLAKALHGSQILTDQSLHTAFGAVLGTPLYMAPEQLGTSAVDVDTRADLYSLGVILYELLTGTTPIEKQQLKQAAFDEICRLIREQEPPRPSTRLSSSDALPSLAVRRHAEPTKLTRLVRGELDWIVMKALEKDRNRRYETANGMAQDVQRYLAGEAVLAAPPSQAYRFRKFIRRHQSVMITAALVALSLVGGLIGTSIAMMRAWQAEADAHEQTKETESARADEAVQRQLAETARTNADARRAEAEQNLAYAKQANQILGSVFYKLDPTAEYATAAELRNALRDNMVSAVEALDGSAIGDPLTVAEMQMLFGNSLLVLGQNSQAVQLFERARDTRKERLGIDHPATLVSMDQLARAYQFASQIEKAVSLFEETLELKRANLGLEHAETQTTMNNLAAAYLAAGQLDKALPLYEQTLKIGKDTDNPELFVTMTGLGMVYREVGQYDKSISILERVLSLQRLKLGPTHIDTLTSINNLGMVYADVGRLEKALPLKEEAVTLARQTLGPDHPKTLASLNNLALGYRDAGQWEKALPILEQTLELARKRLGPIHIHTLSTMSNLAVCYEAAGQPDKAIPLLEQAFLLQQEELGPDHPVTLSSMASLAQLYRDTEQLEKALPLFENLYELTKEKFGPEHAHTLTCLNNLATANWTAGRLDKSIPIFEQILPIRSAQLGRKHPDTVVTIVNLGVNYADAGRFAEAVPLLEEGYQATLGRPELGWLKVKLSETYIQTGQTEKFVAFTQKSIQLARKEFPPDSLELANVLVSSADQFVKLALFNEAAEPLREGVKIRNEKAADAWNTYNARSLLGAVLMGIAKTATEAEEKTRLLTEAEPLLASGYEGLKQREATIPPQASSRIPEALDRLIELYGLLEKPDELEKYRQLRASYPDSEP
ncbi:MAG: serine/threonine protein kinase [Planctomycetaceae bacterium]|nr:serine/threonine protein kinase [Planctomycetaceae bacterium]